MRLLTPLVGIVVVVWGIGASRVEAVAPESVVPSGGALAFDHDEDHAVLSGLDARMQLVVSRKTPAGLTIDATHQVQYQVDPPGIVEISDDALVIPIGNGEATITAQDPLSDATVSTRVRVVDAGQEPLVSFASQVVPIFTKLGCNGGGCHGKAAGQNGFKLSLLGFEPREDFEHLVRESRGRRINMGAPDRSLLLEKAINQSPHGGGLRMQPDSYEYRMMRRWIAQGMPYGEPESHVVSIEVLPSHRRLPPSAVQQLAVLAHYSDGAVEDVTRAALFQSNDEEMADVSVTGLVQLKDLVGDVAVMARYQGHVTVFRADIPLQSALAKEIARANENADATANSDQAASESSQMENVVDRFVFQKLHSLGIPASPNCDDATFLRRVTIDIAGRLPTLAEIDEFQSDPSPDKRVKWIDRLLESPDYADYFAAKWNTILRNRRAGGGLRFANMAFHRWIRDSLDANKPYDQFVREIVAASGSVASHPPVVWYQQVPDINQRIEDAAQLFLGQRIQCARCHHHPYEKWSQADYAKMSAFFATVSKKNAGDPQEPAFFARLGGASARHPKTGQALRPAGLDAGEMQVADDQDPRVVLADWMTDPANPFFARALVNRYWKHFMGRGLVEPEDDLRVTNPPSNPELLDGLAERFVESGYDLKDLVRHITQSQTYQFASSAVEENLSDRRSYSRFYPKRLQAEVLLDAIDHVTGSPTRFAGMPVGIRAVALPDTGFSSYFLTVFGRPASTTACECERSQEANLSQSLHLLNSEEIQQKLSSDTGRAAQLAADDSLTDQEKIIQLYRTALGRPPSDRDLKVSLQYVTSRENRRQAYEDLIWSLINSKEFLFNH